MGPVPDQYRAMGKRTVATARREERFTELFTACYGPVLAFICLTVAAAAFDELAGDPLPWLYRVASRAIANQRRGMARRLRLDDRARLLATTSSEPDHAEAVVETERVAMAFQSLSEADREVLRLVTWDGLDHAAAASVLGCSASAFRVRLHRARGRLSGLLTAGRAQHDPGPAERGSIRWQEAW